MEQRQETIISPPSTVSCSLWQLVSCFLRLGGGLWKLSKGGSVAGMTGQC